VGGQQGGRTEVRPCPSRPARRGLPAARCGLQLRTAQPTPLPSAVSRCLQTALQCLLCVADLSRDSAALPRDLSWPTGVSSPATLPCSAAMRSSQVMGAPPALSARIYLHDWHRKLVLCCAARQSSALWRPNWRAPLGS